MELNVADLYEYAQSASSYEEIEYATEWYLECDQWVENIKEEFSEESENIKNLGAVLHVIAETVQARARVLLDDKTEAVKKVGIEKARMDDLLELQSLGKFMYRNGLLSELDVPFFELVSKEFSYSLKDLSSSIQEAVAQQSEKQFNREAEAEFNAENTKVFGRHQEELLLFLTQNCGPILLEKILERRDLMLLLAADLYMDVNLPSPATPPIGLFNQGNSCYRNATTQMLLHSPLAVRFKPSVVQTKKLLWAVYDPEGLDKLYDQLKVAVAFKQLVNLYSKIQANQDPDLREKMALCDRNLMLALSASKYMLDLSADNLKDQHDAPAYLEAILEIFGIEFQLKETKWAGADVSDKQKPAKTLVLPLASVSIQEMINKRFSSQHVKDIFKTHNEYEQRSRLGTCT